MRIRVVLAALAVVMVAMAGLVAGDNSGKPPEQAPAHGQRRGAEPEPEPQVPWYPNSGAMDTEHYDVVAADGHLVPVSLHKPAIASVDTQFPVLVHSHGFTGTRASDGTPVAPYIAAGFGVVSYDQRGHGDARSTSELRFMQPDYELLDLFAVLDFIAGLDWVYMQAPGDPLVGTIGYSYGGAYQLMGAIFDDRIDAMVPEITWHNILEALAPNGALKSGWIDLFYAAGNAQGSATFGEDFHRGFAWTVASNEMPAGQAPGVPDLVSAFNAASPSEYDWRPVPTLFVQGMPDTLFPLNHAVSNYEAMAATGAPVALYTHNGGHVLSTGSLAPQSPVDIGLQAGPGGFPCGQQRELDIAWHQTHLLGLDAWTGPDVCIALEDESTLAADTFPVASSDLVVEVGTVVVGQAAVGGGLRYDLVTATDEMVIAGIPTLTAEATVAGVKGTAYFSLHIAGQAEPYDHYVNDQVMPMRMELGSHSVDMDLAGVGVRLLPGETLQLSVTNWEPMYFANAERTPGFILLENLAVTLPVV